jgi:hypothetical protein
MAGRPTVCTTTSPPRIGTQSSSTVQSIESQLCGLVSEGTRFSRERIAFVAQRRT